MATGKEPDLSGKEVLVRVDERFLLLIGDIPAAGMTPAELTETIQKGSTNYVTALVVTVHRLPARQREVLRSAR